MSSKYFSDEIVENDFAYFIVENYEQSCRNVKEVLKRREWKHLWTTVYFLILFRVFLGGEHSKWTIVSTTSRCKFHTITRWYNCRGVWWSSIVNGKRCRLSAWWTVVPLAFTYFVINRGRSSCIISSPIYYFIGGRCGLKYILYLPETSSWYILFTWICWCWSVRVG